MLVSIGGVLDIGLFAVWAAGSRLELGVQVAALAQTLIIVGANVGMAGFLTVALDERS